MKVYIDADGNAVTSIVEEICKKYNIPVIAVKNYNINLKSDYIEIVTVDDYKESADLYIANHISKDDILITNDYGLSSLVVNKCKKVINQSGMIIDNSNIDFLLNTRHIHKEMRLKHNVYTKSKKRTSLNDETFKSVFENYILSEINNSPL
ncbi:MAG: YaiI/YqxD family protein [Tissierellia bacterium]|nr:YaiI/YqxD family protein [Tissierellia bacterium]